MKVPLLSLVATETEELKNNGEDDHFVFMHSEVYLNSNPPNILLFFAQCMLFFKKDGEVLTPQSVCC